MLSGRSDDRGSAARTPVTATALLVVASSASTRRLSAAPPRVRLAPSGRQSCPQLARALLKSSVLGAKLARPLAGVLAPFLCRGRFGAQLALAPLEPVLLGLLGAKLARRLIGVRAVFLARGRHADKGSRGQEHGEHHGYEGDDPRALYQAVAEHKTLIPL
jgi:hypothetical protein